MKPEPPSAVALPYASAAPLAGMRLLLNQDEARRYLLQAAPEDVTVVIPFSDQPGEVWTATGNGASELNGLLARINDHRLSARGVGRRQDDRQDQGLLD